MTPLAPIIIALLCSISGTTELINIEHHGPNEITTEFQKPEKSLTYLAQSHHDQHIGKRQQLTKVRSKRETNDDPRCAPFMYKEGVPLTHPRSEGEDTYSNNTKCFTTIYAGESKIIVLTFVDYFEMEDPIPGSDPPVCKHDFLEIRDGQFGYHSPVYRFCGKTFPPTVVSTGPYMWLKFKSDENVQFSGFKIHVEFQPSVTSHSIPNECFKSINTRKSGVIDSITDGKPCREKILPPGAPMDMQWKIVVPQNFQIRTQFQWSTRGPDVRTAGGPYFGYSSVWVQIRARFQRSTRHPDVRMAGGPSFGYSSPWKEIYLNFTIYKLAKPNDCDSNIVQVFGAEPHLDYELQSFCGSVPTSLVTKKTTDNVMYVRMFAKDRSSNMSAQYTAFRTRPIGEEECPSSEFNCLDGTCIDIELKCDKIVNCRLKADEDTAICPQGLGSDEDNDPHMILAIFSVIFSVMVAVFLFKCVMKIYRDQKQINDLLKSNDGTLGKLSQDNLSFDPLRLTLSEPRASLERENQTNEIYKQQRHRKSSSIESDFLRGSMSPDLNNGDWPESIPILENIRIEHKRTRRLDSKKEDSIRSIGSKDDERIEDRDGMEAPDTQEFGCQTRESLFQADAVPSSNGTNSGRNSQRLSAFGYSRGAARVPAQVNASQIVIEPIGPHSERRPMSSETTRSAPDVIIVSKPIC